MQEKKIAKDNEQKVLELNFKLQEKVISQNVEVMG